jgi:hypothetical protein
VTTTKKMLTRWRQGFLQIHVCHHNPTTSHVCCFACTAAYPTGGWRCACFLRGQDGPGPGRESGSTQPTPPPHTPGEGLHCSPKLFGALSLCAVQQRWRKGRDMPCFVGLGRGVGGRGAQVLLLSPNHQELPPLMPSTPTAIPSKQQEPPPPEALPKLPIP